MSNNVHAMVLILTMTAGTMATRFLPFLLLGDKRQTPPFITYLGKVLPYAIMGMLVVYCLKDMTAPFGIPELLGCGVVALLHIWKRSTLLSIGGGTAVYMLLVNFVFFSPLISLSDDILLFQTIYSLPLWTLQDVASV